MGRRLSWGLALAAALGGCSAEGTGPTDALPGAELAQDAAPPAADAEKSDRGARDVEGAAADGGPAPDRGLADGTTSFPDAADVDSGPWDFGPFELADAGHATCTAEHPPAVVIQSSGRYEAPWETRPQPAPGDASDEYHLDCGLGFGFPRHQFYLELVLTTTQDVRVSFVPSGPDGASFALFSGCGSGAIAPFGCQGTPWTGTFRDVPAGTYALVGQADLLPNSPPPSGRAIVEVAILPPTAPAPNVDCSHAVDISAGGTFSGRLSEARPEYEPPTCSSARYATLAYRLDLAAPSDIELTVSSTMHPALIVARDCTALRNTEVSCQHSWASLAALPAGSYYALVGGSATLNGRGSFDLDVRVRTPAARPPGDTCASPVSLSTSAPVSGDLFGATNHLAGAPPSGTVCQNVHYDGGPDRFFAFSLADTRRVEIRAAGSPAHLALVTSCDDIFGTTLACSPARNAQNALYLPSLGMGSYLLRLQATQSSTTPPGPHTVTLRAHVPEATCAAPIQVVGGSGSTTMRGSTGGSFDDHRGACGRATSGRDLVARLDLGVRSRVVIDTTGSAAGAVAYLRASCSDAASQILCASPTSAATLEPGVYWLVIDSDRPEGGSYIVTVDRIPV